MSCFTTSLAALLLVAVCTAPVWAQFVPDPVPIRAHSGDIARDVLFPARLEIETSGSSRFEIAEDAIIASYSGGVVSRYRGYELRCDGLKLNQATGMAILSGNIAMDGPELSLTCQRLHLNINEGTGELWGGIRAQLKRGDTTIEAGHIKATLIDVNQDISLHNLSARIDGNLLLSRLGQQVSTAELEYDGAIGSLKLPQPLVASVSIPKPATEQSTAPVRKADWLADLGTGNVAVVAESFAGRITAEGQLAAAEIKALRASLGDSSLFADFVQLLDADKDQRQLYMSGSPIQVVIHGRSADPLSLTAREVGLLMVSSKAGIATISGAVRIVGRGLSTTAEELAIQLDEQGRVGLASPQSLVARGDLRRLLDVDEVDLGDIASGLR